MSEGISLNDLLSDKQSKKISEISFEHGLKLLEQLVAKVESGTLSLDQSLLAYERGAQLMQQLRALLAGAEEKLKVLQIKSEK